MKKIIIIIFIVMQIILYLNAGVLNNETTQLMDACFEGNINEVNAFIKKGEDVNKKSDENMTALIYTILGCMEYKNKIKDFENIVKILIKNKANPNVVSDYGHLPLIMAIQNKLNKIVEILIKGNADANMTGDYGTSPLIAACKTEDIDIIRLLLKKGANINYVSPLIEESAIIVAINNNNVDIVRLLIKNKANINLKDANGKTVIEIAKKNGNKKILELLK